MPFYMLDETNTPVQVPMAQATAWRDANPDQVQVAHTEAVTPYCDLETTFTIFPHRLDDSAELGFYYSQPLGPDAYRGSYRACGCDVRYHSRDEAIAGHHALLKTIQDELAQILSEHPMSAIRIQHLSDEVESWLEEEARATSCSNPSTTACSRSSRTPTTPSPTRCAGSEMSRKRNADAADVGVSAGFVLVLASVLAFSGAGIVHGLVVMVWP